MDQEILKELLDELVSAFERTETQSAAIMMFLKDRGIANDEQIAPYLKQAGDASNVRWRAARVRYERLLSAAMKDTGAKKEKEPEARPESNAKNSSHPADQSPDEKKEAVTTKEHTAESKLDAAPQDPASTRPTSTDTPLASDKDAA